MSLEVSEDTVTITNTEPDTAVVLRYHAYSGNVVISDAALTLTGTLTDMELLISALRAVKTTEDNKYARRREALG